MFAAQSNQRVFNASLSTPNKYVYIYSATTNLESGRCETEKNK